jgi:hypothetical protein
MILKKKQQIVRQEVVFQSNLSQVWNLEQTRRNLSKYRLAWQLKRNKLRKVSNTLRNGSLEHRSRQIGNFIRSEKNVTVRCFG